VAVPYRAQVPVESRFHRTTFCRGPVRRVVDWLDWMLPEVLAGFSFLVIIAVVVVKVVVVMLGTMNFDDDAPMCNDDSGKDPYRRR
jgi:hypothetical protein